jgi:ribosomal-protein-alanine N-acetyltransferase
MMDLDRQCTVAARWTEAQYKRLFQSSESDPSQRLALVIEEDHHAHFAPQSNIEPPLVAFLVANHLEREWELENVVVKPTFRRQGIGTRLLNEFLNLARETSAESVFLEVRESNQAARTLYLKWGFEQNGRRKGYYTNPPEDAILYRWSLS